MVTASKTHYLHTIEKESADFIAFVIILSDIAHTQNLKVQQELLSLAFIHSRNGSLPNTHTIES